MKSIFKIAACLSFLLLAFSCKLEDIDTQMTDAEAIAAIRLECTAESAYTIPAEKKQSLTFNISSTTPWKITGHEAAASWLSVSPTCSDESSLSEDIRVAVLSVNEATEDRTATLVVSGKNTDIKHTIQITQSRNSGLKVEFLSEGDVEIDRKGGETVIGVHANTDWSVESTNPVFTVQKLSNSEIKVSAPYNNRFAPRKTVLTIRATDSAHSGIMSTKEVSQDINFSFEGDCTVQGDGSVKLASDGVSRVKTIDSFRYATVVLHMGKEVHFGPSGQLCVECTDACIPDDEKKYELQCQIRYNSDDPSQRKDRLRTNGKNADATFDSYNTKSFTITQAELNALTTYRAVFAPEGAGEVTLSFFYNSEAAARATMTSPSAFSLDAAASGHYWFGFESTPVDETWYVVDSCDITPIDE